MYSVCCLFSHLQAIGFTLLDPDTIDSVPNVTRLVAVLLQVGIWKFISMEREQWDGAMYQWISPYGVLLIYVGELRQFNPNFIVVSCTQYKVYNVSQSCNDVHVHACKHAHVHCISILTCQCPVTF